MRTSIWLVGLVLALLLGQSQAQDVSQPCCLPPNLVKATGRVDAPRLTADELKELRLPDVDITSVVHHQAVSAPGPGGIHAAHVELDGTIGGKIGFELLLPTEWNGRFVMGGGGGFVGTVQNAARQTVNQGYATVGTDTGHQWPSGIKARWAQDDLEARVNFGHLAVHRTAEVAKAIIAEFYGKQAAYSYFIGCSRGGGQALMEAQRYPNDFDGIVSGAPAFNWNGIAALNVFMAQHLYPNPKQLDVALLPPELLKRLEAEVLRQCDEQDGVKDGLLDDPRACEFDLSKVEGLTEQQRRAIEAIYGGLRVENRQIYPGMPLGAEAHPSGWPAWITGPNAGMLANDGVPNLSFSFGTEIFKYFVFNDPDWNYATYDFQHWERDTHLAGTYLNATDPDLSPFKAAGGKLILWHGWSDAALTALASIDYYENVESQDAEVRDYFRLYLLPGVMHCSGGPGPDQVDWLQAIVAWVEQDTPPQRIVATKRDNTGNVVMTRPLYPYPLRAKYQGSGSTDAAENFVLPKTD